MKKPLKIVKKVSEKTMDGDNDLEKQINAYLTKMFIGSHGLPSDECLREAKQIMKMIEKNYILVPIDDA